jgi:hypothetical protein
MTTSAYLTSYDALICNDCAPTFPQHTLTPITNDDITDVFGYDSACCEECKTKIHDGLAIAV